MDEKIDIKYWLILAALSIVWGSSFVLMKFALESFEPLDLAAFRVLISGVLLSPILFIYRKKIEWRRWHQFLIAGMLGTGLPAVLFFIAQSEISSTLSGMLNSLTPIWTLIIGLLFFGTKTTKLKVLGVFIGFIGALILVLAGGDTAGDNNILYAGLVVVATMSYGTSGNYVKHTLQTVNPLLITAMSFLMISTFAVSYLLTRDLSYIDFSKATVQKSTVAIVTLSLFGTAIATVVFYYLIQKTSAVFGSTVAYTMPVVAIIIGTFIGESVLPLHMVGILVIFIGVYLTRYSKKPKALKP